MTRDLHPYQSTYSNVVKLNIEDGNEKNLDRSVASEKPETSVKAERRLAPQSSLIRHPGFQECQKHSTPTTSIAKNPASAVVLESASSSGVTNGPHSIPKLLKPGNIKDVESNTQDPGLHQLIISRLRNGGDGPEVEVFSNISEEDYQYVLNAIGSDDKLVRKPSYIPSLRQIIATTPSPIHEAILVPLLTAMGNVIDSFVIPDDFEVSLPIHMGHMLDAPATAELPSSDQKYRLRIPDLSLMFQTRDADVCPYWPFEVSVSQTSEGAITQLQKFTDQNEHVLYPNRDKEGLEKVQQMFQCTLERICEAVLVHLRTEHAHDDTLLNSLQVVQDWSPPNEVVDWKKCTTQLRPAVKQTGFERYRLWHHNFLKRMSDETEDAGAGPRKKRGRVTYSRGVWISVCVCLFHLLRISRVLRERTIIFFMPVGPSMCHMHLLVTIWY
ncbi:uncharacterized protein F5147DRAFT_652905 [Suillus discolor]|uniref:Uncharacterized protein n=1 Tax=Suillus discolor TaxID=1912936 RepID=A0A9P7F782_9AGAM|nr:uncharacterized protein F5147DRAFT_652905 [Suillus discolor]KAG2108179.1 hypothetical protein F5147DRAFT_652905 [Suillus discolor]